MGGEEIGEIVKNGGFREEIRKVVKKLSEVVSLTTPSFLFFSLPSDHRGRSLFPPIRETLLRGPRRNVTKEEFRPDDPDFEVIARFPESHVREEDK